MTIRLQALCICLLLIASSAIAHAQYWSEPSDSKSLGILIYSITQSLQQSKPGDIRWRQAWPMKVDGIEMNDSTFRAQLGEIFTACATRTAGRTIGHPAYEGVFGPFEDFQLAIDSSLVAGDSAIYNCTFGLHLNGEKEVAGLLKFYRVEKHVFRLDTINGLLPLLRSEIQAKARPVIAPSGGKKPR